MKKRQIVFMVLVLLLCFGGAATLFAGGGQQQAPAKPKLTMLFSAGGSGNSLKSSADLFGSRNGVEIEALLFSLTEVYEKEVLALTSQQETPDVVSIDDTWLPVMKDFLQELNFSNDYYSNFIPSMLNTFRWPQGSTGRHYGIPVRMGGDVIAYREDVLKAANIDPMSLKTWEDILAAGKKLTNKDQNIYAWVQGYSEPALIVTQWLNFISSYGQKVFNDDMTAFTFNTPLGIEATQMFVNLARDCATPGILSYGYNEQIEAFQNGSAVMGMLWSARFAAIDKAGLPHSGQFKVLPFFPQGRNSGLKEGVDRVYGWGLGINKLSKNKELAAKFLEFIGSHEEQVRLAVETSNSPVTSAVFTEPSYLQVVPTASDMGAAMKNGVARPMYVRWAEIEGVLSVNLQRAIIGESTVAQALAQAETDALRILGR